MKKITAVAAAFALVSGVWAQVPASGVPESPIRPDDPGMAAIDQMLVAGYLNHFCFSGDRTVLNAYQYQEGEVPAFSPQVIAERMHILDRDTPFNLVYNSTVQGFIDLYSVRRRDLTAKVLGMSELYFPMFEEALARHGIPLEMKYLAVVESALNPSAISSAGAGGLWQFMVSTGKMYGLEVSSYQDERFDAIKATDAACRYLKSLYNLYGDWQLALAAYNSGPGNVNKAIRRSGGKKDFWEIKSFLPRETQGYVPAFIAVNYVMNYASEYNLYPKPAMLSFFETDTVHVTRRIDFATLSRTLDVPPADLAFLNSTYKMQEIPENGRKHYLVLPVSRIGLFLANEEKIYADCAAPRPAGEAVPVLTASAAVTAGPEAPQTAQAAQTAGVPKTIWENTWTSHKVRRGESLGAIADKYNVTLAQLKKWNHIRGSVIHPGQKLKIQQRVKKTVYVNEDSSTGQQPAEADAAEPTSDQSASAAVQPVQEQPAEQASKPKYKYYTIQPGDTLYKIASRHEGVTVNDIRVLNSGLREHKLVVGQRIKLKQIG